MQSKHVKTRENKKMLVQEQEDLQCDSITECTQKPSQSTEKISKRYEQFQDVEESANYALFEVDRYLNQKFDLSKYKDESGKKNNQIYGRRVSSLFIARFTGKFKILKFWNDMSDFPRIKEVARQI